MGSWRLWVNFGWDESACIERKRKNCRHTIKSDETFRSKDQSEPSHCASFFPSRIKTQKQMQTIPLNHQLLYNRLVREMAEWSLILSGYQRIQGKRWMWYRGLHIKTFRNFRVCPQLSHRLFWPILWITKKKELRHTNIISWVAKALHLNDEIPTRCASHQNQ